MPKLFEYLGVIVFFYSNEHEPIHVHGKRQGCESKAELVVVDGKVVDVIFTTVRGRRPLEGTDFLHFEELVRHYADEIVQRWIDYFVLHKAIGATTITQRIR